MNRLDIDDLRARLLCRVDALQPGDRVLTPARRWETVTTVETNPASALARICTSNTKAGYSWSLPTWVELPTLPTWPASTPAEVHINTTRQMIVVYVGTDPVYYRASDDQAQILTQANYLGRGNGWTVIDRPNGIDLVRTDVASKAAAMSLVRRTARAHARGLGLRLHTPIGGERQ